MSKCDMSISFFVFFFSNMVFFFNYDYGHDEHVKRFDLRLLMAYLEIIVFILYTLTLIVSACMELGLEFCIYFGPSASMSY